MLSTSPSRCGSTVRSTTPLFSMAMERIIARHDALRARFSATGETMTISPDTTFPCPMTDVSGCDGPAERSPERIFADGRFDAVRPGRRAAHSGEVVQALR